jgi:hypothetical protein
MAGGSLVAPLSYGPGGGAGGYILLLNIGSMESSIILAFPY